MSARIRDHLRSNVVGYVAIFLSLIGGGSAYALSGSNTVFSDDIVNGQVRNADLADDSVGSTKIADGRVRATDLATDSVTSDKIRDGNVTHADISTNAITGSNVEDGTLAGLDVIDGSLSGGDVASNSLTGDEIFESTLGQVPSALLGGFGRTGSETSCDPESEAFITCAATPIISVPAGARALVLARVRAFSEFDADQGFGQCRLGTSSTGALPNTSYSFIIRDDEDEIGEFGHGDAMEQPTLIGITPPLPAGVTSFGIDCNQDLPNGAIQYDEVSASVVLISAN